VKGARVVKMPRPAALIAALQAHNHDSITVRTSSLHRTKASRVQYKPRKMLIAVSGYPIGHIQTEKM